MKYLFVSYWNKKNFEQGYNNTLITCEKPLTHEDVEKAKAIIKEQNEFDEVLIMNIIPLAEEVQHES